MRRRKKKSGYGLRLGLSVVVALVLCYAYGVYEHKLPIPEPLERVINQLPAKLPYGINNAIMSLAEQSEDAIAEDFVSMSDENLRIALPAPIEGRQETILYHTGYVVSYNSDWKIPNWVAWELTAEEVDGDLPREDCFMEDPTFDGPQATLADYRNSGYTRGHMVPAADMKWSRKAMEECFYLTNMCPQKADFNSGNWGQLERQCRHWAKRDSAILIVCGPIVGASARHIGEGRVTVPTGFFKVILSLHGKTPRAIGFIYPHRNQKGARLEDFMMTVDEVERRVGIDFFAGLPDEVERKVEAQNPAGRWSFPRRRKR